MVSKTGSTGTEGVQRTTVCAAGRRALLGAMAMGIAGAAAIAAANPAAAYGGYRASGYDRGFVVAQSQWGNGTISGAVRPSRHGWQVRMPRGTWIDCVRSCSDTLRRQTIDFWESNGRDAPGAGPGYFRWEFRY